jgi:hypothetical protein
MVNMGMWHKGREKDQGSTIHDEVKCGGAMTVGGETAQGGSTLLKRCT